MDYNQLTFGLGYIPFGEGMALDSFSNMTDDEKKEYIERHRSALSEGELDRLTASLGNDDADGVNAENPTSLFRGPGIG